MILEGFFPAILWFCEQPGITACLLITATSSFVFFKASERGGETPAQLQRELQEGHEEVRPPHRGLTEAPGQPLHGCGKGGSREQPGGFLRHCREQLLHPEFLFCHKRPQLFLLRVLLAVLCPAPGVVWGFPEIWEVRGKHLTAEGVCLFILPFPT